MSPSFDYSKNVRLSSNHDDFDPQKILSGLEHNRIFRKEFDPSLVSRAQLRQYKEIVDRHMKRTDPNYVNVEKEYREGWAGMVMSRDRKYKAAGTSSSIADQVQVDGVTLRQIIHESSPSE